MSGRCGGKTDKAWDSADGALGAHAGATVGASMYVGFGRLPSLSIQDVSCQSRLVFLSFSFTKATQAPWRGRCRRMTERQRGLKTTKTRGSWTIIVLNPRTRVRMPRRDFSGDGEERTWGSWRAEQEGTRTRLAAHCSFTWELPVDHPFPSRGPLRQLR